MMLSADEISVIPVTITGEQVLLTGARNVASGASVTASAISMATSSVGWSSIVSLPTGRESSASSASLIQSQSQASTTASSGPAMFPINGLVKVGFIGPASIAASFLALFAWF